MINFKKCSVLDEDNFQGASIILNACNNWNKWGAGFSGALSKVFPLAEIHYRKVMAGYSQRNPCALGGTFLVNVWRATGKSVHVANMIVQDGIGLSKEPRASLAALQVCLTDVAAMAEHLGADIHLPKICSGYGKRNFTEEVMPVIERCLGMLDVNIYSL